MNTLSQAGEQIIGNNANGLNLFTTYVEFAEAFTQEPIVHVTMKSDGSFDNTLVATVVNTTFNGFTVSVRRVNDDAQSRNWKEDLSIYWVAFPQNLYHGRVSAHGIDQSEDSIILEINLDPQVFQTSFPTVLLTPHSTRASDDTFAVQIQRIYEDKIVALLKRVSTSGYSRQVSVDVNFSLFNDASDSYEMKTGEAFVGSHGSSDVIRQTVTYSSPFPIPPYVIVTPKLDPNAPENDTTTVVATIEDVSANSFVVVLNRLGYDDHPRNFSVTYAAVLPETYQEEEIQPEIPFVPSSPSKATLQSIRRITAHASRTPTSPSSSQLYATRSSSHRTTVPVVSETIEFVDDRQPLSSSRDVNTEVTETRTSIDYRSRPVEIEDTFTETYIPETILRTEYRTETSPVRGNTTPKPLFETEDSSSPKSSYRGRELARDSKTTNLTQRQIPAPQDNPPKVVSEYKHESRTTTTEKRNNQVVRTTHSSTIPSVHDSVLIKNASPKRNILYSVDEDEIYDQEETNTLPERIQVQSTPKSVHSTALHNNVHSGISSVQSPSRSTNYVTSTPTNYHEPLHQSRDLIVSPKKFESVVSSNTPTKRAPLVQSSPAREFTVQSSPAREYASPNSPTRSFITQLRTEAFGSRQVEMVRQYLNNTNSVLSGIRIVDILQAIPMESNKVEVLESIVHSNLYQVDGHDIVRILNLFTMSSRKREVLYLLFSNPERPPVTLPCGTAVQQILLHMPLESHKLEVLNLMKSYITEKNNVSCWSIVNSFNLQSHKNQSKLYLGL